MPQNQSDDISWVLKKLGNEDKIGMIKLAYNFTLLKVPSSSIR